ncbi:hypothetical protein E2R68_06380 [Psychromonas sp. RZ22]|uniref:chondroitinase-B domain-containing protein n=1 Tax=Psychromonas algarum TaxID=2555643 RepID=UPI0010683A83|nr:chondroitinase-B domain-containing protein [Psychromonas sp. RZ22]TEW55366.1 hypothetical protein E2R68_06380 [Psychromonas sp. RZ22]
MFKKLIIASAIATLLTGCGSSSSSSTTPNIDTDPEIDTSPETGLTPDLEGGTAAVIGGDTSLSFYYKDAAEGKLSIVDPDEGEAAFIPQTSSSTMYGLFSVTEKGLWTLEVPEAEELGDLEKDETRSDSITVESIDGTEQTINFTIKSADAKPDDGDKEEDDEEEANTYACSEALEITGSDATPSVSGATHVSEVDDLSTLLKSGIVKGGDEIVVTGDGQISIKDTCFDSQVLIRAENVGSVTLETAAISNSQNIAIQGFVFGPNDSSTLFKIVNSKNIKVLRNKFDHAGVIDGQTSLVLTESSENISIAYNEFIDKDVIVEDDGQINSGSYIKFQYDDDTGTMTKGAHIHHNYFKNIIAYVQSDGSVAGDSDREAIVFGDNGSQDVETYHLVEYNLFEDTDGENEIMTVKTSNNEFSNNTFLNSMGSLSFRLGHDNKAINNYFYGTGESATVSDPNYQTGGVRIYGANHLVTGNYMENLSGDTWRLPILVDSGDVSDSSGANNHETTTNATIKDNILVNNLNGGIQVGGSKYSIMPSGNNLTDNIVIGDAGDLYFSYAQGSSNTWNGNVAYATGSAMELEGADAGAEITLTDDQLLKETSEPSFVKPTPLTTADVGPIADLN